MSQTAAAHPAASRRGMRGAAAWKRYYIDLTYSLVEHVCTLSPMQAAGYCYKIISEIVIRKLKPNFIGANLIQEKSLFVFMTT
jgi:hypothetical protein